MTLLNRKMPHFMWYPKAWCAKHIAFYVESYGLIYQTSRILRGILWPGMSKVLHFAWHPIAWYVKSIAFYVVP